MKKRIVISLLVEKKNGDMTSTVGLTLSSCCEQKMEYSLFVELLV